MEGLEEEELSHIVAYIKVTGLEITKGGDIEEFLGVKIYKVDINTYHLSHPQLINQIVSYLGLSQSVKTPRTMPSHTTSIQRTCQVVEKFDQQFHYQNFIGNLEYL